MNRLPYAEDVNYWKTGKSDPDTWIAKAKELITKFGGTVIMEGFGSEALTGRSAYMLGFSIGGDNFKIVWPVLPTKSGKDEKAARIQAATMLHHDVKAKCISAAVLGARAAFFSYLVLPDGRTTAEVTTAELANSIPELFGNPQLETGNNDLE